MMRPNIAHVAQVVTDKQAVLYTRCEVSRVQECWVPMAEVATMQVGLRTPEQLLQVRSSHMKLVRAPLAAHKQLVASHQQCHTDEGISALNFAESLGERQRGRIFSMRQLHIDTAHLPPNPPPPPPPFLSLPGASGLPE